MPNDLVFDISQQYAIEAIDILAARQRATILHKVKNIVSAGSEVEESVRGFIKRKIPSKYYTTKGHIVDIELTSSSHFDILIADDKGSPVLFSDANKDDFLAFESIYAIGEVKSTYHKRNNPIKEFAGKVAKVNKMVREKTSIYQQTQDIKSIGNIMPNDRTSEGWQYKNPLFKFVFFADSSTLKVSDILQSIQSVDPIDAPNIVCLMDRGVILKAQENVDPNTGKITPDNIVLYPEFQAGKGTFNYFHYEYNQGAAANLSYMIFALNYHLTRCVLQKADLVDYHKHMFEVKQFSTLE